MRRLDRLVKTLWYSHQMKQLVWRQELGASRAGDRPKLDHLLAKLDRMTDA